MTETKERRDKRRGMHFLSAREVATVSEPGMYADGGNLYLRIGPTGARSWIFRYKHGDKRHDHGIGPVSLYSLAEAREKVIDLRRGLREGLDPIDQQRGKKQLAAIEAAKSMTFRQCAEAYVAAHRAGWKSFKHGQQFGATLERIAHPVFGDLPVQAVDVGLIMKALEPVWTVTPETASRVRGRIESVLDWASVRGYRSGDNPARWRGHLEALLPKKSKVRAVKHHVALPYSEVSDFMTKLRGRSGVAARAFEFMILTAARTSEVIGATWSEIDFQARTWTIPPSRMKAAREHRTPISEPVLAILERMKEQGQSDLIFPGPAGRLSHIAMLRVLERMGRGDLTAHGFRSTFSDWCAECTGYPAEVREMALAHAVSNRVESAYRRGDLFEKRRALAAAWAKFCDTPSSQPSGNVRHLHAASA
jgi:integrase